MPRRPRPRPAVGPGLAALILTVGGGAVAPALPASATSPMRVASTTEAIDPTPTPRCSSGAHTLAEPGSVMYPETGNGGYESVHTGVFLRYDAPSNRLLPGTHVSLTLRASRCLTDFSLDFERRAPNDLPGGPDLRVDGIAVDGRSATYDFEQPTYPGDPNGPADPDPRAHQVSQDDPVGGPHHNPLPPACSPSLSRGSLALRHSQDGDPCPATKLVIRPTHPIAAGTVFRVRVRYHGTPGIHHDGDGNHEGWFRTEGGSSMVTEPVGTQAWMPLNNHPSAKPTYDFHITTNAGKTAIANGRLVGKRAHRPSPRFDDGSVTWHWHAPMPIANYLALSMVGDYTLTLRVGDDGTTYYVAQDRHIPAGQRHVNRKVMAMHEDITAFEEHFNGDYPFASDGVVAAIPGTSGDTEEMESMIVFTRGQVGPGTLYHETMHQWWGDNVGERRYEDTFFKGGLAMLSQFLRQARTAAGTAGGSASAAGRLAFDHSLAARFNRIYGHGKQFWIRAPSNPATYTLVIGPPTYVRPGATYVALRAILGPQRFVRTLRHIQQRYGGATITEAQLEAEFQRFLPVNTAPCHARLARFFDQWFDTNYPPGGGANRPKITGPGLAGRGFYFGACHR